MSVVQKHNSSLPVIELTTAAHTRVVSYLVAHNLNGLRLSVKKTGCSGLSYVIDYVEKKIVDDIIINLQDDFFISIDKKSLPFLNGLVMDYVKQGVNYKFTFENPNQTGQCGCGESFTVDR